MDPDARKGRVVDVALDRLHACGFALITLDEEEILPWAHEQGLSGDVAELASEPRVKALVQDALDTANSKYAQVEQVKSSSSSTTTFRRRPAS